MRITRNHYIGLAVGIALIAVGVFACSSANASEFYVKAEVGTTVSADIGAELSDELTYGAYIGTSVGPFRVEAGASHLAGDIDLGGIALETSAIDYNATAYIDTQSGFYVGAGVDYIEAEANIGPWFSANDSGWGYHVSAGYAARVSDRSVIEFQARYLEADLDNVDLSGTALTVGYRHRI